MWVKVNREGLMANNSEHSGHGLPTRWVAMGVEERTRTVSRLRSQMFRDGTYKEPIGFSKFDTMHYSDRWAVINHLIKTGNLQPMGPLPASLRIYSGAPGGGKSDLLAQMDFSTAEARVSAHMTGPFANQPLYDKPNGGKRILRSAYTQLKKYWLRSTGQMQEISDMNDGHLSNTLALLKESHGNLIARSTYLLGKMHMHFKNQPEILMNLEGLCKQMQAVEVDDLYPIWKELAKEKAIRMQVPDQGINLNLWADDDLNVVD